MFQVRLIWWLVKQLKLTASISLGFVQWTYEQSNMQDFIFLFPLYLVYSLLHRTFCSSIQLDRLDTTHFLIFIYHPFFPLVPSCINIVACMFDFDYRCDRIGNTLGHDLLPGVVKPSSKKNYARPTRYPCRAKSYLVI